MIWSLKRSRLETRAEKRAMKRGQGRLEIEEAREEGETAAAAHKFLHTDPVHLKQRNAFILPVTVHVTYLKNDNFLPFFSIQAESQ